MSGFGKPWGRRTGLVLIVSAPAWWVFAWEIVAPGLEPLFAIVGFASLFSGLYLTAWFREG